MDAAPKTFTLITGANKGLGYETARRLIAAGHTVYLGARDVERGTHAAETIGATFVALDVTDDESVTAAVRAIDDEAGRLDVLINNAGIAGRRIAPIDVTADDLRVVYDTNVFGVVRVTHAALPLLERSSAPVIVNVASGLGSLGVITDQRRRSWLHRHRSQLEPRNANGHGRHRHHRHDGDHRAGRADGGFFDRFGPVPW